MRSVSCHNVYLQEYRWVKYRAVSVDIQKPVQQPQCKHGAVSGGIANHIKKQGILLNEN